MKIVIHAHINRIGYYKTKDVNLIINTDLSWFPKHRFYRHSDYVVNISEITSKITYKSLLICVTQFNYNS